MRTTTSACCPQRQWILARLLTIWLKPTVTKSYKSLAASLVSTTAQVGAPDVAARCPQMLEAEAGGRGDGIDVHLALSAVLEFEAAEGRWPALHDDRDADAVLKLAEAVSERHRALDAAGDGAAIWAQTFTPPDFMETFDNTWGVPRELDAVRVRRADPILRVSRLLHLDGRRHALRARGFGVSRRGLDGFEHGLARALCQAIIGDRGWS